MPDDHYINIFVARKKPGNVSDFKAQHEENQEVLEKYTLPYSKGMSALDALDNIRKLYDPSLAYPHSCRHGKACRLCLAEIDGKVDYLCSTLARDGMIIKSIPGREIIRDLIVNR